GQFPPAPGTGPGLPETIEAIESARITTRILYVTAHPDDESAAVLTYLARGLHADVALLSLTRGEGGQNDLGPEQAPQLGLIRADLDRSDAPKGYLVPVDEISPLYGKSWREMGLDAFANHRTQGITGFLGSPFLRRAVALQRVDGKELDPALLAQPLGPLDE